MSLHKNNDPLNPIFENFTEDSEDSEYDINSNNVSGNHEFLDLCADLEECNLSFLYKVFIDNDEINSSDSDYYEDESSNESENESQNEELACDGSGEFDEIIKNIEQKELTSCIIIDVFDKKF
ncbi:hypothetical protein RclHR1_15870001 [Rhizophagus clarus]|uniref:Uncharacterized protein n=1 Tax=Rhizophagus clarus TaxID=94130 RepID=A0A2Z6QVB0_9GLOM|nr:hypothetical protein RclHR1_15870001 [Rhizophagus clarus]